MVNTIDYKLPPPPLLSLFSSSVIIISVVEGIILLTIIFLRTRILIAIALIQESSKSVYHISITVFLRTINWFTYYL